MDRILIDDDILKYAQMYEQAFRGRQLDVPAKLREIKTKLDTYNTQNHLAPNVLNEYKAYVEEIANDYNNADRTMNLLILHPQHFQNYIDKYQGRFQHVELNKELVYHIQGGGRRPGLERKKKFWELIVDAMHYEKFVRPIMVPIIEAMGIRTCVYCNMQYALTIDHSKGLYELDHRYPKSKYPYLCITFYNLQPSCPTCNHGKNAAAADFGLYTTDPNELHPFHLVANSHLYLRKCRFDPQYINIHLVSSDVHNLTNCQLAKTHEKDFLIDSVYAAVKDVAEETIWRCKAYDDTYKDLFIKNFPELYNKDALHRFVFGTYSDDKNVHCRPLTKLIRDIEKDMGVIIDPV